MKFRQLFLLIAIFSFASFSFAQTKPTINQIRAPISTNIQLVGLVNGKMVPVVIGTGIQIVQTGSTYEIRATQPVIPVTTASRLTRSADGSWPLPSACTMLVSVFRNGLRQWNTIDFTVTSNSLRFVDGSIDPSENDDVVVVECRQ
ncbi:MAG: hypothetical protein N3A54_01145 [Patescibacteria group bacterium]|nr:hypothetical protein [Patescibacteria group bacterium]